MALSFIDELSPGTAEALLAGSREVVTERGNWLFHEGDPARETYLITDGIVKILKVATDGTQSLLALRPTGTLIGELSLMAGLERSAGALAAVRSTFLAIRQEQLAEMMTTEPAVARTIIATLSTRLREASLHILELASSDVTELVARRLLDLATAPAFAAVRAGEDPLVIGLPLSQHELGAWAGVSPRSAAGVLRQLRESGIITTSRMEIVVNDLTALADAAGVPADTYLAG